MKSVPVSVRIFLISVAATFAPIVHSFDGIDEIVSKQSNQSPSVGTSTNNAVIPEIVNTVNGTQIRDPEQARQYVRRELREVEESLGNLGRMQNHTLQEFESLGRAGNYFGLNLDQIRNLRLRSTSPDGMNILEDFWGNHQQTQNRLLQNIREAADQLDAQGSRSDGFRAYLSASGSGGSTANPSDLTRNLDEIKLEKLRELAQKQFTTVEIPPSLARTLNEIIALTANDGELMGSLRSANMRARVNQFFWRDLKRRWGIKRLKKIRHAILDGPDELLEGTGLTKAQVRKGDIVLKMGPEDLFKIGQKARSLSTRGYHKSFAYLKPLGETAADQNPVIRNYANASGNFLTEYEKQSSNFDGFRRRELQIVGLETKRIELKGKLSRMKKHALGQSNEIAAAARSRTPSPKKSGGIAGKLKRGLGGAGGILAVGTTLKIFYDLNESRKGKRKEVQIGTRGR